MAQWPLAGVIMADSEYKKAKEEASSMSERQSFEQQIQQKQAIITHLEKQLRDAQRVIDVLVAVGKLKQGHIEEARSIVSSLGD